MEVGEGLELRVMVVAFCTACTPVSDSISTEHRYHTLQAAGAPPQQEKKRKENDTRVTAEKMPTCDSVSSGNNRIGNSLDVLISRCDTTHGFVTVSISSE